MTASVVTVGMIAGMLSVSMAVTGTGAALVQRQALHGAADAAALAAADALFGFAEGDPCGRAAELAALHEAQLAHCQLENTSVRVRLERVLLGIRVESWARAGLSELE